MTDNNGSNGSTGGGNTKPPRVVASRYWLFTFYWKSEKLTTEFNEEEVMKCLGSNGSYIFGYETCPTTGSPHLQGYIELNKKGRPIELFGHILPNASWRKRGTHATRQDNINYCSKEGDYRTNMIFKEPIYDIIADKGPTPIQKFILDITKTKPNDRTVDWFYDAKGKSGKTKTAIHLCLTRPNETYYVNGKGSDIKSAIADFIKNPKNNLKIVIFGIPRKSVDYISYSAIEELKDGIFFSGKFESGMCLLNPPHIIIFSNEPPVRENLSDDRWRVFEITDDKEIIPYDGNAEKYFQEETF